MQGTAPPRWHDLIPAEQDALDRIWRGAETVADAFAPLVARGLVVVTSGEPRLTDAGEGLMLARFPALQLSRRGDPPASA
jgi:hypothetical protein